MAQTTIKGLPVFVAGMDDNCGMLKVSLVDYPAVEKNFLAFDKQERVQNYAVQDEDKQIVFGVLMRANYPIYRKDKELGEYFILFKPEVIREMAEKYLKEGRSSDVNTMHGNDTDVEDVDMVQLFIKDSAAGISPAGFEEIEDGSLFAEYHVNNPDVWAAIKDGTYKGFSIETLNTFEPEEGVISTEKIQDVISWLNNSFDNNMDIKKTIKAKLAAMLGKFGNVTTDKATLSWDGDGELEAGMEVYILDEDGNRQKPEDGDYTTEDGKVIVVVDGNVSEIRDPDAKVAPQGGENTEEAADVKAEKMARITKYAESYEEKERKIAEAIAAANGEGFYFYIVEAGDDYAVICWWTDEDYSDHFRRYAISWDGDNVTLGETTDGHMGFIPDGETPATDENNDMETAVCAAMDEIKALKAEMATMKSKLGESAAKPAHEEFKSDGGGKVNAPKGYEKFVNRFSN